MHIYIFFYIMGITICNYEDFSVLKTIAGTCKHSVWGSTYVDTTVFISVSFICNFGKYHSSIGSGIQNLMCSPKFERCFHWPYVNFAGTPWGRHRRVREASFSVKFICWSGISGGSERILSKMSHVYKYSKTHNWLECSISSLCLHVYGKKMWPKIY